MLYLGRADAAFRYVACSKWQIPTHAGGGFSFDWLQFHEIVATARIILGTVDEVNSWHSLHASLQDPHLNMLVCQGYVMLLKGFIFLPTGPVGEVFCSALWPRVDFI